MSIDERLRNIELGQVKVSATLETAQHDIKNVRAMMNAAVAVQDTRHNQLETDIKDLNKTLFRLGISVVSSIMTVLIALVAYFLIQRDHAITAQQPMQVERAK